MQFSRKSRIKFLTVIWGKRYIDEFFRVSLPSYLAPGNLPELAKTADLEVLILTSRNGPRIFRRQAAFSTLERLCPVRFIFIDDLIASGVYGVTLTLAYARGILDSGDRQTDTCFVFMNSDFVLADGALGTLARKLAEGHRCIMAPSLRACSEAVQPELVRSVDRKTGRLVMPPRDMVRLAFKHLHPTVIGKTVTQNFVQCTTHNQLYWQVDENTLLGRYHLIFMLAIRPERPMPPVTSYCDYGFVPELVPSGRFTILDDSDDFFMLELQSVDEERQFLRCGEPSLREIARELSVWTTREHRHFADVDVVFHADRMPRNIGAVRKEAAAFISRLHSKMRRRPVDHARHFYWVSGVAAWLTLREAGRNQEIEKALPPECGPLYASRIRFSLAPLRSAYLKFLGRMRQLAGAKPHVAFWHHAWLDSRLVLEWLASARKASPAGRKLLVYTSHTPLSQSLAGAQDFDVVHARDWQDGRAAKGLSGWPDDGKNYKAVLCHVLRADMRLARIILERLTPFFDRGCEVCMYIDHESGETDQSNFTWELAQYVHEILPAGWTGLQLNTRFAGGAVKRRLRLLEGRLLVCLWPTNCRRAIAFPFAVLLLPVVMGLTALNNWRLRHGSNLCPSYCSSALLRLTPLSKLRATAKSHQNNTA